MPSPSSLRFAHVADLHLGSSYHLGDEGKDGVNSRLRDFRDAWVRSCRDMVAADVDLVLFAGDAFRDSKPTPTEQQAFRDGLDVLCDARIRSVLITGNHDLPRSVGRTHALAIFDGYRDHVHVESRPGLIHFQQTLGVSIACFPWPSRANLAAADSEFERLPLDEQNQKIVELSLDVLRKLGAEAEENARVAGCPLGSILLAHGSIAGSVVGAEGSTRFFREPVLPLSELRGLPFRYQAWGHLHRRQHVGDNPSITYSGSIERVDFNEAGEDKGWYEVTLEASGALQMIWHSSEPRPFVDLELPDPIAWEASIGSLNGSLPGAIVRVRYQATAEVARSIDQAGIRRALYAGGALKVHGPIVDVQHTVTADEHRLDEETSPWAGWSEYADLQGLDGLQRERLDRKVRDALEVAL